MLKRYLSKDLKKVQENHVNLMPKQRVERPRGRRMPGIFKEERTGDLQ